MNDCGSQIILSWLDNSKGGLGIKAVPGFLAMSSSWTFGLALSHGQPCLRHRCSPVRLRP